MIKPKISLPVNQTVDGMTRQCLRLKDESAQPHKRIAFTGGRRAAIGFC